MTKAELIKKYLELLNPPKFLLAELAMKCTRLSKETLEYKIKDLQDIYANQQRISETHI
jgi:hypothetical protein